MQKTSRPIGFFDSGIGGTSIWKEVVELLPNESTIYLSDSKNAPYGNRTEDEIVELSIKNTEFLLNKNCKLIVVACNTATTNAITYLRETYKVPFIGIEPAIKPAALQTKTKKIGILATRGTLNSKLFADTSSKINQEIEKIEVIGTGLVDLIENGKIHSDEMKVLLNKYLQPMLHKNVDAIVLGCTHYPYLIPVIKEIVGNDIQIIDSGLAVAKQTKNILEKNELLSFDDKDVKHQFYINTSQNILDDILKDKSTKLSLKIEEKDF